MYTDKNYPTKKALKEDVLAGKEVRYFQPMFGEVTLNGKISIEGPHGVHKWYAQCIAKDGKIISVK
jgi:hypothetical protein